MGVRGSFWDFFFRTFIRFLDFYLIVIVLEKGFLGDGCEGEVGRIRREGVIEVRRGVVYVVKGI